MDVRLNPVPYKGDSKSAVANKKAKLQQSHAIPSEPAASGQQSRVVLSNQAQLAQQLISSLSESQYFDAAKVESVRQSIDSANYQIDHQSLAKKILG